MHARLRNRYSDRVSGVGTAVSNPMGISEIAIEASILSLLSLVAFGGEVAIAELPQEQAAIVETMQAWEHAVETNNFDALTNYYAEDAIYYPNKAASIVGRDAIIEKNRQRGSAARVDITQHVDDVTINGNWALYSCIAEISLSGPTDNAGSTRYARVLLVMKKGTDGRWRIFRDIDNNTSERPN